MRQEIALTEPAPDDAIPAYIVDVLDQQDAGTVEAIEEYTRARCEYLAELKEQDLSEDKLTDDGEKLIDVEGDDNGTVVIEKVPCGKDCDGCLHGPHKYVVQRDDDSLK